METYQDFNYSVLVRAWARDIGPVWDISCLFELEDGFISHCPLPDSIVAGDTMDTLLVSFFWMSGLKFEQPPLYSPCFP